MILLLMAINWRNLVQIECIVVNNHYSKSILTITEPYTPDQLLGIRKCVEHDKLLQILPSTTYRNIRHLWIFRRKFRGKWAGRNKTKVYMGQPGLNTDNLLQVKIQSEQKRIPWSKHVSFALCNTQSIRNKDTVLLDHLSEHNLDLCIATETWLRDQDDAWLQCNDLVSNGYKILNVNHQEKRGGRLALIHQPNIQVKTISNGAKCTFEFATWECSVASTNLAFTGIYHLPYSDRNKCTDAMFLDDWAEFLESLLTEHANNIICGDFNLHIDELNNPDAQVFLDIVNAFSLNNNVTFPTHQSGHTLDLILSKCISGITVNEAVPG